MTREEFLRLVLAQGALVTVPPLGLLPPAQQDRMAWTRNATALHIYEAEVRGFVYYDGPKVLERMKADDELDLVREYTNVYDVNAVAVHWNGHKLGFLPMGENTSLAHMIDHGLLLKARVVYTQPEADPWEQCFVAVALLLPSEPGFDAYMDHYEASPDAGFRKRADFGGYVADPS